MEKSWQVLKTNFKYDRFNLPFLKEEHGRIWNSTFDVTEAAPILTGVRDGKHNLRLIDYLVYRPLPPELTRWREMPDYHPDSLDMEEWYNELLQACSYGIEINGEYFNPLFVYWLNVFVFEVPIYDENKQPTGAFDFGLASYSNIDRYFLDYAWRCMLAKEDIMIMGARGIAKTFMMNCIIDRRYRLIPQSQIVVSSTNEDLTNEAWRKLEVNNLVIEERHPALKLKKTKNGDSADIKEAGEDIILPDGTSTKKGHLSRLEKIIYGKEPGKTRGRRPDLQLIEEFAAFPPRGLKGNLRDCMKESRGSWFVMGTIKKCTVLYAGTGGTANNDEAKEVFLNPKAYNIGCLYDFKESGSAFFVPVHLKAAGTWELTGCPDVALALEGVERERKLAASDPISLLGLMQEYPITIDEVFRRSGVNTFNQEKIAEQRADLLYNSNLPKPTKYNIYWDRLPNGRIQGVKLEMSNTGDFEILELPVWMQADSPTTDPIKDLYASGCDSIDQGSGDSSYATDDRKGSKLAMLVKKRFLKGSYFNSRQNYYIAKYHKRSDDVRKDWEAAAKLAVLYHTPVNIEYTKIGIISHFRTIGLSAFLRKRAAIALANPDGNTNLIGTQVNDKLIHHQDSLIKSYIDDFSESIFFDDLLGQLQGYSATDRTKFDLVIAMGLTELSDEDLLAVPAEIKQRETEGLELFGYYTDPVTGYKKYGVIPGSGTSPQEKFQKSLLEEEQNRFKESGGMRWVNNNNFDVPTYDY
jgi:hypothetical protein